MKQIILIVSTLLLLTSCSAINTGTWNGSGSTVALEIAPPTLGSGDHKLDLYLDYQCPACINFSKTLGPIVEKLAEDKKLLITYKQYPLTKIHPNAYNDALAALCAHSQGKYLEYKKTIYGLEDERKWAKVTDDDRVKLATDLGLDQGKFNTCLEQKNYAGRIATDVKDGDTIGVSGTPTLILDDKSLDLGMFRSTGMFQDFMNRYLGVTTSTGETSTGMTGTGN